MVLRKWAFLWAAVAALVIGCSTGGGGGGGTTTTGGGTTGQSTAVPNIPNVPAMLSVFYLTGQGRAAGSATAVIRRLFFTDQFGLVETILNPERYIGLDAYTSQSIDVSAP